MRFHRRIHSIPFFLILQFLLPSAIGNTSSFHRGVTAAPTTRPVASKPSPNHFDAISGFLRLRSVKGDDRGPVHGRQKKANAVMAINEGKRGEGSEEMNLVKSKSRVEKKKNGGPQQQRQGQKYQKSNSNVSHAINHPSTKPPKSSSVASQKPILFLPTDGGISIPSARDLYEGYPDEGWEFVKMLLGESLTALGIGNHRRRVKIPDKPSKVQISPP